MAHQERRVTEGVLTMAVDPPSDDIPEGGPYSPGPNKYTGGGTSVDDVTPGTERSEATTHAEAAQDE
jgi:hypothetical protein